MSAERKESSRRITVNRKAYHDFLVTDRLEAGIELRGTEVKSLRDGTASLSGAYAEIRRDELFLCDAKIPPYRCGNQFNHDPERPRRLLVHRKEISRLVGKLSQKGFTLIPLSLYFKGPFVKVELGLCRGKTHSDKREDVRRKEADRAAQKASGRRG